MEDNADIFKHDVNSVLYTSLLPSHVHYIQLKITASAHFVVYTMH